MGDKLDADRRLQLAKARAQAADVWRAQVETGAVLHRQRAAHLEAQTKQQQVVARRLQHHVDELNAVLDARDVEISRQQRDIRWLQEQIRLWRMGKIRRVLRQIRARLRRQPLGSALDQGRPVANLLAPATASENLVTTPASDSPDATPKNPVFVAGAQARQNKLPDLWLITALGQSPAIDAQLPQMLAALQHRANIFLWNLGDAADLAIQDRVAGHATVPDAREDYALARQHVRQTHGWLAQHAPDCTALVLGQHCKSVLPALVGCRVPLLCVLPDAAVYADDIYFWQELFFWADYTAFVSASARRQALAICSYLRSDHVGLLPGAPWAPAAPPDAANIAAAPPSAVRQVLGWGPASRAGGLDAFVQCALALKQAGDAASNWHFLWLLDDAGTAPDPEFLLDLREEIALAGLSNLISLDYLTEKTRADGGVLPQADLCLLPHRTPLSQSPAGYLLGQGIPVLGFAGVDGAPQTIADQGFAQPCLAPLGDIPALAQRLLVLVGDDQARQMLAAALVQADWRALGQAAYADAILGLCAQAKDRMHQAWQDEAILTQSGQLDAAFMGEIVSLKDEPVCSDALSYIHAWRCGMGARKPRAGFHPGIYAQHGIAKLDTADGAASPPILQPTPFADYLRQGCPVGPWDFPVIRPGVLPENWRPALRTALHIHAYYPDMLVDMIDRLHLNRTRPDLFISVPGAAQQAQAADLLADYQGRVQAIEIVPNRGRDIGPFISTFGAQLARDYDLIGHIHTKRSPHADRQVIERWRVFLMENLLGGSQGGAMLDQIVAQMAAHPQWGMAFADDPLLLGWDGNLQCAQLLAQWMGVANLPQQFLFPAGTMFWLRPQVLQPFLDLGLQYDDYPDEPLPVDGSVLHALERLFGAVPQAQGVQIAVTSVPGLSR